MTKSIFCGCLIFALASISIAQIVQGGDYRLEQSVIAAGGGASGNGAFTLTGTIGQSIAGNSNAGSLSIQSGFYTFSPAAPTAATASIEGRLLTAEGQGIRNASITVVDANGTSRATTTGAFGYFKFDGLPVGTVYTITVLAKKYRFDQSSQVVILLDQISDLTFIALPN